MNQRPSRNSDPIALHQRAEDNLRFIRQAMEGATVFTGVSGMGYVLAGLTALAASWIASRQVSELDWLLVWMVELLLGASLAFWLTFRKARAHGMPLLSASGRKLLFAFLPAMLVGGLCTLSFALNDRIGLLPGLWLCLYGAAVMTAGAWSIALIPVMGATFLLLGAIVLLVPVSENLMLGLGLGGVHVIFGLIIWRYYGG